MSRDDELPAMSVLHWQVFDYCNKLLKEYHQPNNTSKDSKKNQLLLAKIEVLSAAETFLERDAFSTQTAALTAALEFMHLVKKFPRYTQQRNEFWKDPERSQTDRLISQVIPMAKASIGDSCNYTTVPIERPAEEDLADLNPNGPRYTGGGSGGGGAKP